MEQLALFDIAAIDEQEFKTKASKVKLNYSSLLRYKPEEKDEFIYNNAIIYRKIIANLLMDLSKGKLEAESFLTLDKYKLDREIICSFAYIDFNHLNIWTQQILNGALCFNYRILDDHIKYLLDIKKSDTPPDLSLIEDWGIYYPNDALDKNLTKQNLSKLYGIRKLIK